MLNQVAEYHNEWILYVGKICSDSKYVEDIVQEMYIKLETKQLQEKVIVNGSVNKWYILTILKNLVADYYRAKKKVVKVDFIETFESDFKDRRGLCPDELQERHQRHINVCQALNNEHSYYERLWLMYTSAENPSLQDLADESGVSKATLYNDLKKIKKILRNGRTKG